MKTEIEVLIEQLDNRFGNEKAPKQYQCIQEAVSALKTLNESDLVAADLAAIKKAENFGKEFGQFKPLVDTVTNILRMLKR